MLAIISDIHGNYPALEAVIADIDRLNCEQVICLGDVAGYYCMINDCIDLLRERNIVNLMGNHDDYLVHNKPCPRSNSANACLDYQRVTITEHNHNWLSRSLPNYNFEDLRFVHAGWNDSLDEYLYDLNADYFKDIEGKYFFSGHTHVQVLLNLGEKIYCNPGAVGQPRDGDWRAAYAILDHGQILLRRIEYDVDRIASAMKDAHFDPYYYTNLYNGTRIGGQISKTTIRE